MRLVISDQLVLKYCSIASPPNLKGELTADARSRNSHKDGFPAVLFRKILLSKGSDISLQTFLTLLLTHWAISLFALRFDICSRQQVPQATHFNRVFLPHPLFVPDTKNLEGFSKTNLLER
jgi:hypothetical protein